MNEVEFTNNVFGLRENYTIRNTKESVEVESDKKYFQERSVVEAFLRSCIDMDTWYFMFRLMRLVQSASLI